MRMTRAALRAQAHTTESVELSPESNEDLALEQETQSRKHFKSPKRPVVHEDIIEIEADPDTETETETETETKLDVHAESHSPVRRVLRDITDENYPQAQGEADDMLEVQTTTPIKSPHVFVDQQQPQQAEENRSVQRSTRKGRSRAKVQIEERAVPVFVSDRKQNVEDGLQALERGEDLAQIETEAIVVSGILVNDWHQPRPKSSTSERPIGKELDLEGLPCEPSSTSAEQNKGLQDTEAAVSPTLQIDPAVQTWKIEETASTTKNSVVQSPQDFSPVRQLSDPGPQVSDFNTRNLRAVAPLRRVSSATFEESFEAMDSLEDTIEKLTAGLPLLAAEEMDSPESPIKAGGRSAKRQVNATPNTSATRTPKIASGRLHNVLKLDGKDKENTPPQAETPVLHRTKTPREARTPVASKGDSLKPRSSPTKSASPKKAIPASARKVTTLTKSQQPASTPAKMPAALSHVTASAPKTVVIMDTMQPKDTTITKPTTSLHRRPAPNQPLANVTNAKRESVVKKPLILQERRSHQSSTSFSGSPAKQTQTASLHQRRITSGGVLSTNKPGFVPVKSTKPPTTITFALPGEAVAEKLKAQKEAREEKMKQPKLSIAEQKAAKLKADREAREERVRANQLKAKEAVAEKAKIARPVAGVLTISKARTEAAEKGRQASREWAEKMLKKKMQQGTPESGRPTGTAPAVVTAS